MTRESTTLGAGGVSVLDCVHATPAAVSHGFPYIAIPNIRDGRIDLSLARQISEVDLVAWTKRNTPRAGDVVVTRRGRVGDSARIPAGVRCAIGQNLVLLRSDEQKIDQSYLYWYCRSPQWWSEVDRLLNVGAVFDSLNVSDIPKMQISLPSLAEQRRIAVALGGLEDLIELDRGLVREIDELELVLFREAWDGKTWARIDTLGQVTMGQSPPGSTYNESGVGLVFYQGVRDFGDRYPTPRVHCTEPSRKAVSGDILIAVRAPIGETNVAVEETAFGRGLASLRAHQPSLALQALRASNSTWSVHEGAGTVFSSISGPDLKAALVPRVVDTSLEAQLQILDAAHLALAEEIRQLTSTRDELLPLLMSGRLHAGDVAA